MSGIGFDWEDPSTQGTYKWVPCSGGQVPDGAVECGIDKDGSPLYVGRASYKDDLMPAKVKPSWKVAYVTYNGEEIKLDTYEVMVSNDVAWKKSKEGEVPKQAIVIGKTKGGDELYYGRTYHEGTITPGKIQPAHKCLYIPFHKKELIVTHYEILLLV